MKSKTNKRRDWFLTIPARVDACDCEGKQHSCPFSQEQLHTALSGIGYRGQLEEGEETGYLHFQVLVRHKNPLDFNALRNRFAKVSAKGINIEAPKNLQACEAYVTKLETRAKGFEPFQSESYQPVKAKAKKNAETIEDLYAAIDAGATVDDLILAKRVRSSQTLRLLDRYEAAFCRKGGRRGKLAGRQAG